ncbi:MAG: ROK family protein, partial [Desulfovermiculus sp.]|nr:ROK family protein [Desulfovermiculus sp.]
MYISIDLGGTNVRGTWVDSRGQYGRVILHTRPRTQQGTKESLKNLVCDLQDQAPEQVQGIGLATAGPLDHRKRMYLSTTNMPELDHFRVGEFLEEAFSLPVRMENDAQAAALGEVWAGSLPGTAQAVVITLGTGVGSGVILNHEIWRGGHFTGPELGHVYLGPGPKRSCQRSAVSLPSCGCGQVGCAEAWLQKQALIELFTRCGYPVQDPKEAFVHLEGGDTDALRIMDIYGRRLGLYISVLQVVFGFSSVGISGGLSAFFPYFQAGMWATMRHRFADRKWWLPQQVVPSPDPEMSALLGMARVFILESRGSTAWMPEGE